MASSYLHRLDALEERLGVKQCDDLCARCLLAKLHAEKHGSEWAGCNSRPVNIDGLTDEELEHGIPLVREWAAASIGPALSSSKNR